MAIILDHLIDSVFRLLGYDPVNEVEAKVCDSLSSMRAALLRDGGGDSSAKKGALRQRLDDLHEARSQVRRAAIRRLLKQGGME